MDLCAPLTVRVAEEGWTRPRLRCTVHYRAKDPYVVRLSFPAPDPDERELVWTLSRELLTAGLDGPSGDGDVACAPHNHRRTAVTLRGRHDHVTLTLRTACLRRFLIRSYQLVPAGTESGLIDWDLLARQLCSRVR